MLRRGPAQPRRMLGVLLLLDASCSPLPAPGPSPGPGLTQEFPTAANGPSAAPPSLPTTDPLGRRVLEIAAEVAKLRGITRMVAPRAEQLPSRELATVIVSEAQAQLPERTLRGQTQLLSLLGLLPEDFNYSNFLRAVAAEQLAGAYSLKRHTLLINASFAARGLDHTLAHELTHALQDERFGLGTLLKPLADRGDQLAAIHAFAEGEATWVAHSLYPMPPQDPTPVAHDVPPVLQRSLLRAYSDGMRFVQSIYDRGGWQAVDHAWQRPPLTTEQLLHLDRYDRNEPAAEVELPPAPTPNCRLDYDEQLGEQTLAIILEEWLEPTAAAEAASGWNGDRAAVFRCPGGSWLRWRLAYDSPTLAAAAAGAWAQALAALGCALGTEPPRVEAPFARLQEDTILLSVPQGGNCPA